MPTPTESDVREALRAVIDPDLGRDIVSLGFVKNLAIEEGAVSLEIELTTPACPVKERMRAEAESAIRALPGVTRVELKMGARVRGSAQSMPGLAQVRNLIAIASGKGGVGKSTVAANLAIAFARAGARVGLVDADVYGPTVPKLLGGGGRPVADGEGRLQPLERWGVKLMSIGLLVDSDTPVIWRGPMASRAIQQLLGEVAWGALDYLFIDLPPGTGDVQLTLSQSVPLTGAVIVTTPQDVAVGITLRGLHMFERVEVPILGIVENMSGLVCLHCGRATDVFPRGGGRRAAETLGVSFLGEIPLDAAVALAGDAGRPVVTDQTLAAGAPSAKAITEIAGRLAQRISIVQEARRSDRPALEACELDEGALVLRWSGGAATRLPYRALRLACPCAYCVDERTGERRLDPKAVPLDVRPTEAPRRVGRYALQIHWSDGHATGLYDFTLLRGLAEPARAPEAAVGDAR